MTETRITPQRIDISSPTAPTIDVFAGMLWYNTTVSKLFIYNGTTFREYADEVDILTVNTRIDNLADEDGILNDTFSWTNETNIQNVFDDLESNFYQKYVAEHYAADGKHGPHVTIDQTGTSRALTINRTDSTSAVPCVDITAHGAQTGACALRVVQSAGYGAGEFIRRTPHEGPNDPVVRIEEQHTTGGYATATQALFGAAAETCTNHFLLIGNPPNNAAADPTGGGVKIHNTSNSLLPCVHSIQEGEAIAFRIDKSSTGASSCIFVANTGTGDAVTIDQKSTAGTTVVHITNSGSGYDVRGNSDNWWVEADGDAKFDNVEVTSGTLLGSGKFTVGPTGEGVPLDAAWHDITGMSITTAALARAQVAFLSIVGIHGVNCMFRILVDGSPATFGALTWGGTAGAYASATGDVFGSASCTIPLSLSAGAHTVKMQAYALGAARVAKAHADDNATMALWTL